MSQNTTLAKRNRVIESNTLVRGNYNFSLPQLRVFLAVVAQIDKDDHEKTEYEVDIPRLMKTVESKNHNLYAITRDAAYGLQSKVVNLSTEEGKGELVSLFYKIKYDTGTGKIKAIIHPELRPHVSELKESFTQYDLMYVIRIPSAHSLRLYRIFKSHKWHGKPVEYSVVELKEMLQISDKYSRYYTFKTEILERAIEHLADYTDIRFSYEPSQKKGKAVTHLNFTIVDNEPNKALPQNALPIAGLQEPIEDVYRSKVSALLLENAVSGSRFDNLMKVCDYNYHYVYLKALEVLVRIKGRKTAIKDVASYLCKAIRDDYYPSEIERLLATEVTQGNVQVLGQEETRSKKDIEVVLDKQFRKERDTLIEKRTDIDLQVEYLSFVEAYVQEHGEKHVFVGQLKKVSGAEFSSSNIAKMLFYPHIAKKYLDAEWHSLEAWQQLHSE